jgi:NADH-quinone oxidoreductase subunit L
MGGLRKVLPWTYGTFMLGWLAIVGVPPFAGFWAKGSVLDAVFGKSPWLWGLGLFTALLTAYYMSRLFYLTFTGAARFDQPGRNGEPAISHPHESPWTMRLPLVSLAICSVFGGLLGLPFVHSFGLETFLEPVFGSDLVVPTSSVTQQIVLSTADAIVAFLGLGLAFVLWRGRAERPALTPRFFEQVWFWDNFYDALLGRPATKLAEYAALTDALVIDGAVDGTALAVKSVSTKLRLVHNGQVRSYGLGIVAGLVALLAYFLVVVA